MVSAVIGAVWNFSGAANVIRGTDCARLAI